MIIFYNMQRCVYCVFTKFFIRYYYGDIICSKLSCYDVRVKSNYQMNTHTERHMQIHGHKFTPRKN